MTFFKTVRETSAPGEVASRWNYATCVLALIAALFVVRLICAAVMPLAGDEILYWRYSKHLAAGYLDHPAMNPFLIRLGTTVFGQTSLGVRIGALLVSLPATWAMWRAGAILLQNERAGATTALFFHLTMVMGVGSFLATSDASVVATSAFVLYGLAKLSETQRGIWWLVVGVAFGVGMWAKYTTFFFAFSIAAWLLLVPQNRRWFFTPWPYLAGLITAVIFTPVLIWNAQHEWASASYQSSRMIIREWSAQYPLELIASQIGLATPPIFILACIGLFWGRGAAALPGTRILLAALIAPVLSYFLWHSLHERVQGNWPECIFPALCCAAALALHVPLEGRPRLGGWVKWSKRLAAPVGVALAALVYAQSLFAIIPLRRDPTARLLSYGWPETAAQIDAIRQRVGSPMVFSTDYTMSGVLDFYLPPSPPVVQINDRVRWMNEPPVDDRLFEGQMLYVCKERCRFISQFPERFSEVEFIASLPRLARNGAVIERYSVYRLAGLRRYPLDAPYPVRLKGVNDDTL